MKKHKTSNRIKKLITTFILVIGLTTGVLLVQQEQSIQERAASYCTSPYSCVKSTYYCEPGTNKGLGFINCRSGEYCCIQPSQNACTQKGGGCYSTPSCAKLGKTPVNNGNGCDAAKGEICCSKTGGINSCSNKYSNPKCDDKIIGDSCDTGMTCQDYGTASDGKIICKCKTGSGENGGGGGNGGGENGGNGGNGGDEENGGGENGGDEENGECGEYNKNPSVFNNITKDGELTLYSYAPWPVVVALKKNTTVCSENDYDVKLDVDKGDFVTIPTGLQVASGDDLCIYVHHQEGTQYPASGWVDPDGNQCGRGDQTPLDISDFLGQITNSVSTQCWGDYEPGGKLDCDFNDFVLAFSLEDSSSAEGFVMKLRFQGIDFKALDQVIKAKLEKDGKTAWASDTNTVSSDDNGLYSLILPQDSVEAGKYQLLVKGPSHLQRRIENINYQGGNQLIDLTKDEKHLLRAGDVNGDNTITIEDVARVSRYYTKLRVAVNNSDTEMKNADINKDGYITIQDIALIAINWSEFVVEGDK